MKALILAAGKGTRFTSSRDAHFGLPQEPAHKCLSQIEQRCVIEFSLDAAIEQRALFHTEAKLPRDDAAPGPRGQIVEFGTILASDLQQILESRCGNECRARPFALQQCVGGHRGAVDDVGPRCSRRTVNSCTMYSIGMSASTSGSRR